ncbi:MAG TPA: dihydrolipoyl dehydrogenase [Deinococcales bacterium]|nr:dihydrolipoyl dehydrogenase [Deinococcales bacterium]
MDFDLIVIGSGPGGYHAAIRAAQLGLNTAVAEKGDIGGVCLNVGCIPTKALLHVASTLNQADGLAGAGIEFGKPQINLHKVEEWKEGVVSKLTGGVSQLLKANRVTVLEGEAVFRDAGTLSVGGKDYTAGKFIIATGSSPVSIPGFDVDNERIVDSTGALAVSEVPERFLAIGGSAIGLEFADIYNALGSEVTVVELMDRIVPTADADVSRELARALKKRGVKLLTGTKSVGQKQTDDGIEVTLEAADGTQSTVTVDRVLVAVGRRPNSSGLGLDAAGVEVDERGFISAGPSLETNVPGIYAIGDVAGMPLLAHKAMKEGLVAAEHAAGQPTEYDTIVPSVIYTNPELASVGMTEEEATEAGHEVRVGRFPLAASGRALTMGIDGGTVKLIGDADSDLLLGFHMVGPGAGELVAEAALALEMGATLTDVALTQHAHPTLSEAIMEAAEQAHGQAIHTSNRQPRRR